MVSPVYMPKLGLIMAEGTIVSWEKKEGEMVKSGETIAVMETEKTTMDISAPASGTLLKVLAPAETTVLVGKVIAYIGDPGEAIPDAAQPTPAPATAPLTTESGDGSGSVGVPGAPRMEPSGMGAGVSGSVVRATPRAKKVAKEMGVELSLIKGTGPMQMISEEDVLQYVEESGGSSRKKTVSGLSTSEVKELSGTRRVIAERMTSSLQTMAQLTLHCEADASELVRVRATRLPEIEAATGTRVTYTEMLVKAVARALTMRPIMNSTLEDKEIKVIEEVNIGIAVASDSGLMVPVIRSADRKSLVEVVQEAKALAEKVRSGKLELSDVSGGTFTLTNLGTTAVDYFTPIINPPQVAILGVGRIVQKPVVVEGKIEVRHRVSLSLTFDHRVVDGYTAGEFLKDIIQIIESGDSLAEALR